MMEELDIRYSFLSDGQYLRKWLKNEEDMRWYPVTDIKEMEDMAANWIGFSKFRASLTSVLKNEVCGIGTLFLMPYKKVAHQCMFYMIVGQEFRRRGIGSSLLKNIINLAKNYFHLESIYAEIFEKAPIIRLIEKLEFVPIVYQDKYVKQNGEYVGRVLYQKFL
ncbi:MAG: hypothetical protein AMS24_00715 [Chlamydiae bacterium SM23_39]|nr:MAG: hypothetical protein AMS24_00715 [Chlamydiae bacterium SM23_39]